MVFALLAVVAFFAVLLGTGGVAGALAAVGWTTYTKRRRPLFRAHLAVNVGLTLVSVVMSGSASAWFLWFGGNIAAAAIRTAAGP